MPVQPMVDNKACVYISKRLTCQPVYVLLLDQSRLTVPASLSNRAIVQAELPFDRLFRQAEEGHAQLTLLFLFEP